MVVKYSLASKCNTPPVSQRGQRGQRGQRILQPKNLKSTTNFALCEVLRKYKWLIHKKTNKNVKGGAITLLGQWLELSRLSWHGLVQRTLPLVAPVPLFCHDQLPVQTV